MVLLAKLLTLIIVIARCGEGSHQEDYDLPVMVFDEGDTSLIPCLKEANEYDFFWSKGKSYDNGTNIAYIARGIPSDSNKYDVHIDGTLVIHQTSLVDEGNYFCRILSDSTESYVGVKMLIIVKAETLGISIEGCDTTSSCLRNFESPTEIKLSCSANVVAESMTLKWYNGTKELRGDVATLPGSYAGKSLKMINVIHVFVEDSFQLTCEADGFNIPRNMAIVQLNSERENTSEKKGDSRMASFVAAISLGVICVILAIVVVFLIVLLRKKTTGKPTSTTVQYDKNNGDLAKASQTSPETEDLLNARDVDETAKKQTLESVKEAVKQDHRQKEDKSIQEKERQQKEKEKLLEAKDDAIEKLKVQLKEKEKELEGKNTEIEKKDKQLTEKEKELERKNMEIGIKDKQLTQKQQQSQDLQTHDHNLPQMQQRLQKLQQEKENIAKATHRKDKLLQNLLMEITEVKHRALQNLTQASSKVALVVKPESYRWEKTKLEELSSKYNMVCTVSSNTPNEDLNAMAKYIVESSFDGGNGCIVIFGDQDSGVLSILHGEKNVKGLMENISHQIFCSLDKMKGRGFQVILNMSMCNTEGDGKSLTLRYPEKQQVFIKKDRLENLEKYNVKSEEELTRLTSRMAPNTSHMIDQGFVRYIIEIPLSKGTNISGSLTIVSVIGVKHIPRFWTAAQAANDFENLLFPVFRDSDATRFLIGHCHPEKVDGVETTWKATKEALDNILPTRTKVHHNEIRRL